MSIEFPLFRKHTRFGPISNPRLPVAVKTTTGYLTYWFLVDTGADYSLVPRDVAIEIGLDGGSLPEAGISAIGASSVTARVGYLPIRLGGVDFAVRCIFVDPPGGLFLLGRADFLDRFVLTIDSRQQRIILDEIP